MRFKTQNNRSVVIIPTYNYSLSESAFKKFNTQALRYIIKKIK